MALSILVAVGGKRLITVPRMGAVRFGPARQRDRLRATGVTGVVVAASLGLLAVVGTRGIQSLGRPALPLGDMLIAVLVVVVFCAISRLLDWGRLCPYAVLLAAAVAAAPVLDVHTGVPAAVAFCPAACVPLVVGIVVLVRLVRTCAPPKEVV
jgi:hypothetical protein